MQGPTVVGCNRSSDWSQHKIAGKQEEEITKCEKKTAPLTFLDFDQLIQ